MALRRWPGRDGGLLSNPPQNFSQTRGESRRNRTAVTASPLPCRRPAPSVSRPSLGPRSEHPLPAGIRLPPPLPGPPVRRGPAAGSKLQPPAAAQAQPPRPPPPAPALRWSAQIVRAATLVGGQSPRGRSDSIPVPSHPALAPSPYSSEAWGKPRARCPRTRVGHGAPTRALARTSPDRERRPQRPATAGGHGRLPWHGGGRAARRGSSAPKRAESSWFRRPGRGRRGSGCGAARSPRRLGGLRFLPGQRPGPGARARREHCLRTQPLQPSMSPAPERRVATAAPSPLPSPLPPPPPPTAAPPGPSEHFSRFRSAPPLRRRPRLLRSGNSPEVGRKVSVQSREPRPPPPRLRVRAAAPARDVRPRPPSAAGPGGGGRWGGGRCLCVCPSALLVCCGIPRGRAHAALWRSPPKAGHSLCPVPPVARSPARAL